MSRVECRFAGPDDAEAMAELWTKHSGWGELAGTVWAEAITTGPLKNPLVVLAESVITGELVGQIICHRLLLNVDGTVRTTIRPFAAVVATDDRGFAAFLQEDHPLRTMTKFILDSMPAHGEEVVYWLPDPRFVRFLREHRQLELLRFPMFSRPIGSADGSQPIEDGVRWSEYEIDGRAAQLCAGGTPELCHVARTPELLAWKQRVAQQRFVAVERHGELVGIAAGRRHGDRQWQIEDVLGYDDAARCAAISASIALCARLERDLPRDSRAVKAAILTTPTLAPLVESQGFAQDRYDFVLAVGALTDAAVDRTLSDPSAWYVSASD